MQTLTMHYEITPEALENGELTETFLNNTEASFGKMILDYIKEGNLIAIHKYIYSRGNVEVEKKVIGVDPDTSEQTTLIEKVLTDSYSYTVVVQLLKTNVGAKQEKCMRSSKSKNIQIVDGKIINTNIINDKKTIKPQSPDVKIDAPGIIPDEDIAEKEILDQEEIEKAAKKAIEDQKKEDKKNKPKKEPKEPKEPNEKLKD